MQTPRYPQPAAQPERPGYAYADAPPHAPPGAQYAQHYAPAAPVYPAAPGAQPYAPGPYTQDPRALARAPNPGYPAMPASAPSSRPGSYDTPLQAARQRQYAPQQHPPQMQPQQMQPQLMQPQQQYARSQAQHPPQMQPQQMQPQLMQPQQQYARSQAQLQQQQMQLQQHQMQQQHHMQQHVQQQHPQMHHPQMQQQSLQQQSLHQQYPQHQQHAQHAQQPQQYSQQYPQQLDLQLQPAFLSTMQSVSQAQFPGGYQPQQIPAQPQHPPHQAGPAGGASAADSQLRAQANNAQASAQAQMQAKAQANVQPRTYSGAQNAHQNMPTSAPVVAHPASAAQPAPHEPSGRLAMPSAPRPAVRVDTNQLPPPQAFSGSPHSTVSMPTPPGHTSPPRTSSLGASPASDPGVRATAAASALETPRHSPQASVADSPHAAARAQLRLMPSSASIDRPQPRRQYPSAPNSPARRGTVRTSGETRAASVDAFEAARRRATTQAHDPAAQLEYARALVQAADRLAQAYADPVTPAKGEVLAATAARNREVWQQLALKITKKLATRTMYPEGIYYLGCLHSSGTCGLDTDNAKAFELYERAARLEHADACYRVAVCLEFGVGATKNLDRAVASYEQAAALGSVSSMYKLGMLALQGAHGRAREFKRGLQWLQQAAARADERNPHALHELGLLSEHAAASTYSPGDPIPLDCGQAVACFVSAARLGYAPAQLRLARAYEYGELQLPISPADSVQYYLQAAEQNDTDAQLGLAGWYWTGAPALRKNDSEAFMWAERAATGGNVRAQFCIGYFYEHGVGVRRDLEQAKQWYTRAAQRKHARAAQRLLDPVFA